MNPAPFRYRRAVLSFIAVLLVFFGIVVIVIVSHERDMFDEAQKNARSELELMGTFVRDAVLRHDYAEVEQFLTQWGKEHEDIAELTAVAPNNFVIVRYRRPAPTGHLFRFEQRVSYAGRYLATLEMMKDLSSVRKSLNRFILQLVTGSVLLTVLLGIALWFSMKRLALKREIAIRGEAERKFRALVESAPDAMIFLNGEGRIALANAQAERLFGYSRRELEGKEVESLMPERFREIHRRQRALYLSMPVARPMGGHGFEPMALAKNGREFPVDISLSPVETEEGIFILADVRDMSERKVMEEKIKRAYHYQSTISSILQISMEPVPFEEQLGRILDTIISIPLLPMQSKGGIFLVEEEPDVLVMKVQRGYSKEMQAACAKVPFGKCLCGMAVSTRQVISCESDDSRHEIRYEGMVPHSIYCIPVVSGERVLGVISLQLEKGYKRKKEDDDLMASVANTLAGIIERRRTEKEKEHLREQLVQAEKLSALGRLTANVAHEIRNPLTSIGGYARRLKKKMPQGTYEKEYVGIIIAEVDRLEKILRNVLTYSREPHLNLESHDIAGIIDESLKTFEIVCRERSIKIEKAFTALPPIVADGDQLREVIDNLISNAIDSMPGGGTLTISTAKGVFNEIVYLTLKVTDTGEGIPGDKLKLIFEPFFTTKVLEQGTGLGLAISKKIVEDHGGFVRVESSVGKGSSFSIHIPYRTET